MTPERLQRLKNTLDKRQPDLTLVTDYVHKGRNLAALIRSADAVGIADVHGVLSDDDWQVFRNTASGSVDYVTLHRHENISAAITPLKDRGYQIIAAQLCDEAVDYRDIDYTQPTALLMGAERYGISDEGVALADKTVVIPMMGMTESFNVSVAATIILMEAMFQRQAKGMYDHCHLDDKTYQRLLFRWSHPKIRDFCDVNNLPYPSTRKDGEVVDAPAWYARAREIIAAR
ncbi:MAG: tRNA (guanosine(18)-2'-O)-methyltransferase TrmH [Pseudomonadales bacterium]|nr:tRNA (guanosine(18)-2'-O)-methyltransferase TrmH [Pseudomonadales bacterium]